jgi:integrase
MEDADNYISLETFDRILETIPALKIRKWIDEDVEFLFKIMYYSALRPSEGIMLKKEDFDLKNRIIYLGKTKTKKTGDKAPIPRIFLDELSVYLNTKDVGRLLPDLKYDTMYKWMKRIGIIANVPAWIIPQSKSGEKTVGHGLRKSVGKHMFEGFYGEANKSAAVIAGLMRHGKPSMTFDHYLNLKIETVKESW